MKRIGFLTSDEFSDLIDDDRLALEPLAQLGIEAHPVVWDQNPDFTLDGYVFRSCWDYHRKTASFLEFLERLEKSGKPVFNSPRTIRWNYHKGYLQELAMQGIRTPITFAISGSDGVRVHEIDDFLFQFPADGRVVIKPAISMSGHDTYSFRVSERANILDSVDQLAGRDLFIQEYIPEIESEGEVSLIFFNGEFSHALRKRPAAGEFRVQHEYGGSREFFNPSAQLQKNAEQILACVDEKLLYARVDGVERGGDLILIELEVIDPMLYMYLDERIPRRFAKAIAERL